jgi:membrane protease YdiL (CAAX protease family)
MDDPEAYLERVVGHDLDAGEYFQHMPALQKLINGWEASDTASILTEALRTYQEFQRHQHLSQSQRFTRAYAILLGEAGRVEDAKATLGSLTADPANAQFIAAFGAAYLHEADFSGRILEQLAPPWARDKLAWRLATSRGEQELASRIEARILARGKRLQSRATVISAANLLIIGTGLCVIGVWLRQRNSLVIGSGLVVGPWTVGDAYGLLVRAAGMGLIVAGGLAANDRGAGVVGGFATLLSGLPLYVLARRHFPELQGWTAVHTLGLTVPSERRLRLILFTLAVGALMILGEMALSALTARLASGPVTESVPEELLFNSWPSVALLGLDAVVWAPLVEEIAFRGLLYATLRRPLPVWAAAAGSSAIFGAVHGYSLQGFLVVGWSGLLWALAYEKSKSLWPCILCHGLSNVLAFASPVVFYRL